MRKDRDDSKSLELTTYSMAMLHDTFNSKVPAIYVLGSYGRRLSMANCSNLDEYENMAKNNPQMMPRKTYSGIYDIDLAINQDDITWHDLANKAKEISMSNRMVEIDPHQIVIMEGCSFQPRVNSILPHPISIDLEATDISFKDRRGGVIKRLSSWNQLHILLSSDKISPKNFPEISLLTKWLDAHDELKDRLKIDQTIEIISKNSQLFHPLKLAKYVYHTIIPYKLRLAIRNFRNNKTFSFKDYAPNYESKDPVYL